MGKGGGKLVALAIAFTSVPPAVAQTHTPQVDPRRSNRSVHIVHQGIIYINLAEDVLNAWGWSAVASSELGDAVADGTTRGGVFEAAFPINISSSPLVVVDDRRLREVRAARFTSSGALVLSSGSFRSVIGGLTVEGDRTAGWQVKSTLGRSDGGVIVFELHDLFVDFREGAGRLLLLGELTIAEGWATQVGVPQVAGMPVGTVLVDAEVVPDDRESVRTPTVSSEADGALDTAGAGGSLRTTTGPDVIVGDLHQVESYGSFGLSDVSAFAVGTVSCNIGDQRLSWYANTNQHPVIAQNMYRLKNGRFEQIGMSWVKHGFYAISGTLCGPCDDSTDGTQLGVGCSDPYSAALNGAQYNMNGRSIVNPHTGYFPYPHDDPDPLPVIGRRLQVHNDDLNPVLNAGALYFVEGHYVTPDDAAAGNQNNNASYRQATVSGTGDPYVVNVTGVTHRSSPAIRAWQDYEPSVVETNLQVDGDGLFILAAKAVDLGGGSWHYEYALQNLNSDRGAVSLTVPVSPGASLANIGFHDVDYHSGEPYSGADWGWDAGNGAITWSTTPVQADPNANALRWGTLYSFWLDADVGPGPVTASVGLFKRGIPASVEGTTIGPNPPGSVCGDGTIEPPEECDPPDGTTCHTDCTLISGDALRGGLLWDKWWVVTGSPEPTGNHPLYPAQGAQAGSETFRCKECHGWDYKGSAGAYGEGPHYTGIVGVAGSTLNHSEMFELLKGNAPPDGHDLESYALADQDIWDVVHFVKELVIDTDQYIDASGAFIGDEVQGEANFTSTPGVTCATCHGADGTAINFGTPQQPEWVGTVAADDPWRLLHKTRVSDPGTSMPSWLANGGTDQGAADIGRYAQMFLPATCLSDSHCDDGLFCNGAETCVADACVDGTAPCLNQPCDELTDTCGVADSVRGGRLWDRWWEVMNKPPPKGNHPLYPPAGEQSGSDTHRCKECHGWDYKGASGAYGSGPHFTGIGGVFGSAMTPEQMFALIAEDGATIQNGHGFAAAGMTEQDIWDVIYFVQELAIDTDLYIDAAGQFLGDAAQGATLYESGPPGAASRVQAAVACGVCHGPDGTAINFGTSSDPEWVGTVAVNDPWQLLHEVRVGLPQGTMMSWLSAGGTDQDVADIGLYAQLTFPVECTTDTHCDDSAFCTGVETCADRFCVPGVDPCPGAVCDETTHTCLSGACAPPLAEAAGSRYLAITPGPIGSAVPQAILVEPQCPGGVARYVGSLRCGGTGAMCRTDADCNTCSFGHNPCLTDADCDFGFCDDGSECSLAAQNCTDMSECVRVDFCELGDACVAGTFATVDVNADGLPDGLVATLVDDPTDAAFMTPDDWSASVMRCSKSSLPCTVDSDCDHGACSNTGPCSVSAQNCTDGSVCVLDESCMPGRVYVTGEGIVPSDWVGAALAPVTYAVRGDCGTVTNPDVSLPASATMWRWGDANNDVFVNVSDIQLIVLAIQGVYTYSTVATDDLSGRTTCEPQQLINVTDVLMAIRALQGERYIDIACYHPCP